VRMRAFPILGATLALGAIGISLLYASMAPRARAAVSAAPAVSPRGSLAASTILHFVKNPDPAPPFLIRDLFGNMISMPALNGKVVFLNFWATWCGPCREEIPELIALQSKYKDKLVVIGASEDEGPPEQVANFAKRMGVNYSIIMSSPQLEEEYGGVAALPTSFVIDEQGRVVQKHIGLYPLDFYDLEVRALLGQPVDAKIETFQDTGQVFLKNASRASELPGVSFAGLSPEQRKQALKQMNSRNCTCGCGMTLAQCRINDPPCATSNELANKIVREVTHPGPAKTTTPIKSGAPTHL
jgi:thiol-disulfide isomerase/thioredoxin